MKNRKLIVLMVINIILIIIILSLILRTQIIKEKEVLKDMTQSEQVDGLELQINNLNEAHEQYAINVQKNKKQIAEAITEMGVETSQDDSIDIIANNIKSIENNNNLSIYSTTETIVGTWIDGKNIYRKVIEVVPTSAEAEINHNIENIEYVTSFSGILDAGIFIPLGFHSGTYYVSASVNTSKIVFRISSIYVDLPMKMIIEYTKTTD